MGATAIGAPSISVARSRIPSADPASGLAFVTAARINRRRTTPGTHSPHAAQKPSPRDRPSPANSPTKLVVESAQPANELSHNILCSATFLLSSALHIL